jgi:hypothetical protein
MVNKIEDKPKKSLYFNIVKYLVATLPIVTPFLFLMMITKNDILISILGTLAIDVCLIIAFAIYYVNKQNGNIALLTKRKKLE